MTALKHQADKARKWRSAIRNVKRHFPSALPACLFLTDPARTPDPVSALSGLPRGSGIIYRHFGAETRHQTALDLSAAAKALGLRLLIAADPDLAKAVEADGVHWPEARLGQARVWRNRFAIQTASAHSRQAIWRASQLSMDAVLVSSVFPSDSPSAERPLGVTRFRRLVSASPLPVYGLGGVTALSSNRISQYAGLSGISGFT